MNILHCFIDDKFIDGTIRVYESDKRHQNRYVVFNDDSNVKTFKYIKSNKVEILESSEFLHICESFDVVILHSFNCIHPKYIINIPEKCKVIWYGWGYDYYEGYPPFVRIDRFNKETKKYLLSKYIKEQLSILIHFFKIRKTNIYRKRALARIDYFSGVFPYEYDLLKTSHNCFKAQPLDFYYGDIDFFVKKDFDLDVEKGKRNVIIGNSADPSNNHHDVLTYISKNQLPKETKIIIPLSYEGTPKYKEWIKKYANSLFPGQTEFLQEYLPLNEYLSLISKCKVAIFFHERQQASDNIFMQLMYGAKVYMSETSLAYQYLKSIGFYIFSLQNDWPTMMDDLPDEIVISNRKLLSKLYSSETIIQRVRNINDILEQDIMSRK